MRKRIITLLLICVMLTCTVGLFTACSDNYDFNKFVKFEVSDVEKIEITSQHNVIKVVDTVEKIELVFSAFATSQFVPTQDEKYESDWGVNRKMTVDFYLKGKEGYYSVVLNIGTRAMNGFKSKAKTGFYTVSNVDQVVSNINTVFYM